MGGAIIERLLGVGFGHTVPVFVFRFDLSEDCGRLLTFVLTLCVERPSRAKNFRHRPLHWLDYLKRMHGSAPGLYAFGVGKQRWRIGKQLSLSWKSNNIEG